MNRWSFWKSLALKVNWITPHYKMLVQRRAPTGDQCYNNMTLWCYVHTIVGEDTMRPYELSDLVGFKVVRSGLTSKASIWISWLAKFRSLRMTTLGTLRWPPRLVDGMGRSWTGKKFQHPWSVWNSTKRLREMTAIKLHAPIPRRISG